MIERNANTDKNYFTPMTMDEVLRRAPVVGTDHAGPNTSSKYVFVNSLTFVEHMQALGWSVVGASQKQCRPGSQNDGFQRHLLKFSRPEFSTDPERQLQLWVRNDHTGGGAYVVGMGVWEKVCSNGLYRYTQSAPEVRIRHMHVTRSEIYSATERFFAIAGSTQDMIQILQGIDLEARQQIEFAEVAKGIAWGVDQPEFPAADLLRLRRHYDRPNSLWVTFNAVQENIMKGGIRYETDVTLKTGRVIRRQMKTRPVRSMDRNIDVNARLFQLAEHTARALA